MTIDTAKLKTAASLALDAWNKFISLPDDVDLERGLSLHEMSLLSAHDAASNPATVLELIAALEAAEKRNAELEARTVKLPPCVDDLHGVGMVMSADAVTEALSAAGINLETGGE